MLIWLKVYLTSSNFICGSHITLGFNFKLLFKVIKSLLDCSSWIFKFWFYKSLFFLFLFVFMGLLGFPFKSANLAISICFHMHNNKVAFQPFTYLGPFKDLCWNCMHGWVFLLITNMYLNIYCIIHPSVPCSIGASLTFFR